MILIFGFMSGSVFAQPRDLDFNYLNQKQGLSNTFVTSFIQDSNGYIWVGTFNGLNRFDGFKFQAFYANPDDSTQLNHYYITTLYVDHNGLLWVGTQDGLHYFDESRQCFVRCSIDSGELSTDLINISGIREDADGNLYISVSSGIFKRDVYDGCFKPYFSTAKGSISCFDFGSDNCLYFGLSPDGGIYRYTAVSQNVEQLNGAGQGPQSSPVRKLLFRDKELWIATLGEGLWAFNTGENKFKAYPIGLSDTDHILDLYIDNANIIWTIDYTGLKRLNEKDGTFYSFYYYNEDPNSIRENPMVFFQDMQDNYWVGHNGAGVGLRVPPNGIRQITTSRHDYWRLGNGNVLAIAGDAAGRLWMSTGKPELTVFDFNKGLISHMNHSAESKGSLGEGTIFTLFESRDQTLWTGTYKGGLQYYDPQTEQFRSFLNNSDDEWSIGSNDIRGIDEDAEGYLWLVTYGHGIDKFDRKNKRFYHYTNANAGLANPYVNQVLCATNGDVWVATVWGLSRLLKGEAQFVNYYTQVNDSSGLSSNNIFVLHEDRHGDIWVGTDQGLNRFDIETGKVERFTSRLLNQTICAIEEDDTGGLWLSTYTDIVRFMPESNDVICFDEATQLDNNSFLPRSSFKDENGQIFFGGTLGVSHFYPSQVRLNNFAPITRLTAIHVLNKKTDPLQANSLLKKHISCTEYFEVEYNDNIIAFDYTGLNYNLPQENKYSYMLEGLHEQWQKPTQNRSVSFINLAPGDYTFMVKSSNGDGIWNESPAQVRFRVNPPWYQTRLFIFFLALFTGLLIWIVLLLNSRRLRNHKRLLTLEVERQTRALKKINAELIEQTHYLDNLNRLSEERQATVQAQAEKLELQSQELKSSNLKLSDLNKTQNRIFSVIAHDLISPFTSILGMTELLRTEGVVDNHKERMLLANSINVSASRVFDLLQNLLFWAKSQSKEVKFKQEDFMVRKAIEESTAHLRDAMAQKSIAFSIECPGALKAFGDLHMFKTVVRNLTGNAVKFTNPGGQVQVNVTERGAEVYLEVIDNGVGIRKEKIEKLFDIDVLSSTEGTEGEQGTGMGLLLCQEFVVKNEGLLNVHSIPNEYTSFSFTIPSSSKVPVKRPID